MGSQGIFLLRPITVVFYVALLAGQYSFDRIGMNNPFYIPERLFGIGLVTFLAFILGLANIKKNSTGPSNAALTSLPIAYALLTSTWGANVPDFWSTVTDLTCMLLACLTISILLRWDSTVVAETLLWCLAITGIIFSLAGLASASGGDRVAAFGGGPNVYSRITMLGFIAVAGLVLMRKLPLPALAFGPLMLIATVASGSRGGMLAGLVSLCVLALLMRRLRPFQIAAGLGLLIACMFLVYEKFSDTVDQVVGGRIVQLTFEQGYTSGRGGLLNAALDLYNSHIVTGSGLRGFEEYYGQGFTYPHNLVLQTAAEGGSIGLVFLIVALSIFARRIVLHHHSQLALLFSAAATVIFVSSMFSGDYYDARFLWIFMIVAMSMTYSQPVAESEPSLTSPTEMGDQNKK